MRAGVARVFLVSAVAILLALAYTGITGGIDQLDQSSHDHYTIGQIVQTVLQLVYGVLSAACIAVRFWAKRWTRPVVIAWAASLILAGALAPVVWGHSGLAIGMLSGAITLLVAWVITLLLKERRTPGPA